MANYILRRVLLAIPTILVISIISFVIIQLPPGDFLTSYIAELESSGATVDEAQGQALRDQYGLNQPLYVQYGKWVFNMLQGDFGQSLQFRAPVRELVGERLALTFALSIGAMLAIWLIALPLGIYSAVRRYSPGDYLGTFLTFVGLGIPDFLLGLIVMWVAFSQFGVSVGGVFSPEYIDAPWSMGKARDMLAHMALPVMVLAAGGIASLMRIMRANLLDELRKPYVTTARAKGMPEGQLLLTYPVRVALNPFVSVMGYTLPGLVSRSTIVSVVLSVPTTGPMLLKALLAQDMYLAGTIVLLLSLLTVIGTLVSDILLAWLDPRIRLQ